MSQSKRLSNNAIVTGGDGQLGSYITKELVVRGYHVFSPGKNDYDVTCNADTESIIQEFQPKVFINCAAISNVGDIPLEEYLRVNTTPVEDHAAAILNFSPETRYANIGSSEELRGVEHSPQDERDPCCPKNAYGESKNAARKMIKAARSFEMFAVQPFCYNFESPLRKESFLFPKIVSGLLEYKRSKTPLRLGNIEAVRDWSHASDIARGVVLSVLNEKPKDYILASGKGNTVARIVELAAKMLGISGVWQKDIDPLYDTFENKDGIIVGVSREFYRETETVPIVGNSSLAWEELEWKSRIGIDEILKEMIDARSGD